MSKDKKIRTTISLTESLRVSIKAYATEDSRSFSSFVELLLRKYVESRKAPTTENQVAK